VELAFITKGVLHVGHNLEAIVTMIAFTCAKIRNYFPAIKNTGKKPNSHYYI